MISGGKSKYQNLLVLVQNESPRLFKLIQTLCLEGPFHTQKYQNTFLLPNTKLIEHLEELTDKDEDKEAINGIRSLILKGHINKSDFTKGATIGTIQFGHYVLAEPEVVGKEIADSNKHVIHLNTGAPSVIVYNYKGDLPPKTVEGTKTELVPVSKKRVGGFLSDDFETVNKFSKKLVVPQSVDHTITNFFKAVAAALLLLKEKDKARYHKAKFYLAANPVVAWYLLTMQGCHHALVKADEVKELDINGITKFDIIQKAESAGHYKFDPALMKEISSMREKIASNADKHHFESDVKHAYEVMLPKMAKHGAFTEDIPLDLKIRMDELRFMNECSINNMEDIQEAIDELSIVENYSNPKNRLSIVDKKIYTENLKSPEYFACGPKTFLGSAYFLYMPLTDEIEKRLMKLLETRNGGAINGGNPATMNTVAFAGGAARGAMHKLSKQTNLHSIVRMLSKEERSKLKELL